MCMGGGSSMPAVQQTTQKQEVAAPTYADAVTKATTATRNKTAALAGRNIKTSARGLSDDANTDKKNLLGG